LLSWLKDVNEKSNFTANVTSGPGGGGSIGGTFFYDSTLLLHFSDTINDSVFFGPNSPSRTYFFNPGGLGMSFTGILTDSFTNDNLAQLRVIDGTLGSNFFLDMRNGNIQFKIALSTTDTTLINGLGLPTNLFVPTPKSGAPFPDEDASAYGPDNRFVSLLQITGLSPVSVPEPATLTLLAAGLLAGAAFRKRFK